MPRRIARQHFHVDGAIGVRRAPRIGVIGQAVLRAQLLVDAVEDHRELGRGIRKEHGSAGGLRNGLQRVFAGGIAAVLILYRTNHNGYSQTSARRAALRAVSKSERLVVSPASVSNTSTRRRSLGRFSMAREPSRIAS